MDRDQRRDMLERVRLGLGRETTETPAPPDVDEALARLATPNDDLVALFCERATGVGIDVHRATVDTLETVIATRLRALEASCVAINVAEGAERDTACAAVAAADATVLEHPPGSARDPLYDTQAGITDVKRAIAETGSLLIEPAGPTRSRGGYVVPPVHMAIVPASKIVPDLIDHMRADSAAGSMPAAQILITGPSKTADIEGILIVGVHGPEAVEAIVVEDG